jgi:uncharacterized protein YigA (DUF484 family)
MMSDAVELDAEDVAHYLARHPDFFVSRDDLVLSLKIPGPHGKQAISLSERQILALREKLEQRESFLSELMSFGEENDVTSARVHKLAVALLSAPDQDAVLRTLNLRLAGSFIVPHVALRLWGAIGTGEGISFSPVNEAVRQYADTLMRPFCGTAHPAEFLAWFGEHAGEIHSFAAVPLREGKQVFGLLVMGSEEPDRFYEGMGIQYLEWIGELVVAALLRTRKV